MERYVEVLMSGETVKLSYNLRRLAKMEREAGKTVMEIMRDSGFGAVSIDTTIILFANSQEKELSLGAAADTLQDYCDNGGSLTELNVALIQAIYESGIVLKGSEKNEPMENMKGE